jgi:hypothetical protein
MLKAASEAALITAAKKFGERRSVERSSLAYSNSAIDLSPGDEGSPIEHRVYSPKVLSSIHGNLQSPPKKKKVGDYEQFLRAVEIAESSKVERKEVIPKSKHK